MCTEQQDQDITVVLKKLTDVIHQLENTNKLTPHDEYVKEKLETSFHNLNQPEKPFH